MSWSNLSYNVTTKYINYIKLLHLFGLTKGTWEFSGQEVIKVVAMALNSVAVGSNLTHPDKLKIPISCPRVRLDDKKI